MHLIAYGIHLHSVYLSLIRVGIFCVNSFVVFDVFEGVVHQASHAAHVAVGARAVNQLLLAQGHQLPCLPEVLTLQ